MNEVQVFFLTAPKQPRLRLSRRVRLFRRNPRRAVWPATSAMVRLVTGCRLSHVAIGHGDIMLDQASEGRRCWPMLVYARRHPTLLWMFRVPVPGPVDLVSRADPSARISVIRTLIWWITSGKCAATNCVSEACCVLRIAGVAIPPTITTPALLFDWLLCEDYQLESLT